jgi:hypothetical protein
LGWAACRPFGPFAQGGFGGCCQHWQALYQISTTFSGKLAFLSHSTYFVKIRAVVKFSFFDAQWGEIIFEVVFMLFCVWH